MVAWVRYGSWLQDFVPPHQCNRLSLCMDPSLPDLVELRMRSSVVEEAEIQRRVAAQLPADTLMLMVVTPNLFGACRGYVGPTTAIPIWQTEEVTRASPISRG